MNSMEFYKDKNWRKNYHFCIYKHKLVTSDGLVFMIPYIVIKNQFNIVVCFTNYHRFVDVFDEKTFSPITSNNEAKLYYICMMLNYILIDNYDKFKINHIFNIDKKTLECFFQDYAMKKLPNGNYRGEQTVDKCISIVTEFFRKLERQYGGYISVSMDDLYREKKVVGRRGKLEIKYVPEFKVKGVRKTEMIFREIPTDALVMLIELAFRDAPDIALAICLQAFAGLRASETMNVRQECSPQGRGITFTEVEGRVIKAEINLTQELQMRSDGVICGRIKRERRQCVYPSFLRVFMSAYDKHKEYLAKCSFEEDYCPMFINRIGKAMTYAEYRSRFIKLIENHLRPALLESENYKCRIYGQLLYENNLGLHSLRHWYSVQLVLHGEDIAQVQFWRGDKNPESAFLYLQNKGELLKELKDTNNDLGEVLLEQGGVIFGKY